MKISENEADSMLQDAWKKSINQIIEEYYMKVKHFIEWYDPFREGYISNPTKIEDKGIIEITYEEWLNVAINYVKSYLYCDESLVTFDISEEGFKQLTIVTNDEYYDIYQIIEE